MLVLAGSFSYTSLVSFSEESLLHSPCCFQWAVLETLVFNHACMPDVSFSERRENIDVADFHVGRQKSYSRLMKHAEKESKPLEKTRQRQGLCGYSVAPLAYTAAHDTGFVGTDTASMGQSARSGHSHSCLGNYGPTGPQRPLTHRI